MVGEAKLPAKTNAQNLASLNPSGGLVARGLAALRNRSEPDLSSRSDKDLEELFKSALDRADYETAFHIIHTLENRGSKRARELESEFLFMTQPRDFFYSEEDWAEYEAEEEHECERVERFLRKAAESGDPLAQEMLSGVYNSPVGDYAEAAKWARMAAENGRQSVHLELGLFYYHGKGAPQDFVEAMKWLRSAAEQENPHCCAQFHLGKMYYDGEGVPRNFVKAREWFIRAGKNSNDIGYRREAQLKLSDMY
jgi:TPR repeat protein